MAEPILTTHKLTRRFGGLVAVRDVELAVARGEILGLIGPNGAGKSTLFKLIAGIIPPTAGSVEFGGRRLSGLRTSQVCRLGVAATHQIVRPFRALSVLNNVMVGAFYGRRPRPAHERARDAARKVVDFCGLGDRADSTASSLNLAGHKRLEIARALATEPQILLLDEVLAGLNPAETDRTLELVRAINARGITLIVVEHNLRAVRGLCSRAIVMDEGRTIAEGAPDAVLGDPRVVEAYLGTANA